MEVSKDVQETKVYREAMADCGCQIKIEEDVIKRAMENIKYYSQIKDEIKGEFLNGVFNFKG